MNTRRDFLRRSALLAGGILVLPTIVPARVLGSAAPSNRINVAAIGCGRQMVNPNIPQMLASQHAQVVAACDVDRRRLDKAVKQVNDAYAKQRGGSYNGCKAYEDFREVLTSKDVDAVMISTPDHWHVPMAVAAARAGKHVSLEKAISTCIGHGRRMVETFKQYPVITRNDSEFRTLPMIYRAIELVRNGRIGKIEKIHVAVPAELNGSALAAQQTMPIPSGLDYDMWLGPAFEAPYTENRVHPQKGYGRPGWLRVEAYCNGVISSWGGHMMGLVQWANDSEYTGPVSVEGSGEFDKGLWNTLNRFDVKYTYANGVEVHYKMDRPYMRVEGSKGWVEIEYPDKLTASSPAILNSKIEAGEWQIKEMKSDKEDFFAAIKENRPTLEPLETAHRTVSMCQLGLIAVKLGSRLTWDPAKEDFVGDNAASALIDVPIRETYFKF